MQTYINSPQPVYAGFWARLSAYLIDLIVVGAGQLVVRLILFLCFGMAWEQNPLDYSFLFQYTFKDGILYAVGIVYFVLCTYHGGATLGKKALNLKVISAEGKQLSFLDVLYRETIGRFLSAFVLGAGYILVGITNEKKGLHDILCDTRVVYEKKIPTYVNGDINRRYVQSEASSVPKAPQPPVPPVSPNRPEPPKKPASPAPPASNAPKANSPGPGDIYDRYRHVEPKRDKEEQ